MAHSAHPFTGGETLGLERINHLIVSGAMSSYKDTRNGLLGLDFSTKLSAYLAFGCITARQIHTAMYLYEEGEAATPDDSQKNLLDSFRAAPDFGKGENLGTAGVRFELLWRDYMRLCARKFGPKLFSLGGFRGAPDATGWKRMGTSTAAGEPSTVRPVLDRFLAGRTGIAFIDASQRELFLTGYTSNRVRQNIASFLAKHLNIDWRLGAEWYECMLVDYDVASNWGNWQYVAGVGNDPRQGRIFNPVKQALDYDAKGGYVKTWIPELRGLDTTAGEGAGVDEEKLMALFQPWKLHGTETQKELGLGDEDWLEQPLVKINFSVGRRPRSNNRGWSGRGNRGRGGRGSSRGRGRGRGGGRGGDVGIRHSE
jgi:deoxyribodipyrimidine photo-lyase